jgi:hypothetical protein
LTPRNAADNLVGYTMMDRGIFSAIIKSNKAGLEVLPGEAQKMYRSPLADVIIWGGFFVICFLLSVKEILRNLNEHDNQYHLHLNLSSGIFGLGTLILGYSSLRVVLWRVIFHEKYVEWRDYFALKIVQISDIEYANYEVRGGKGISYYFVIKLKSGKRLVSAPLRLNDATVIAKCAQEWLLPRG